MIKDSVKHLIAILITSLGLFITYCIITIPIIGVFFIDDAITGSELLSSYFNLAIYTFGFTLLIIFPLNLLFDFLSKFSTTFKWLVPILLLTTVNLTTLIFSLIKHLDWGHIIFYCFITLFLSFTFLFYRIMTNVIDYIFKLIKHTK